MSKQPEVPGISKQPRRRTRTYDPPIDNVDEVTRGIADLLVPPGTYVACASNTEFNGWKLCNGQALDKGVFSRLYDIFGGQFGEDETTFNLPDWTGRSPIGAGGAPGVENMQAGGDLSATLTVENIPPHTHDVTDEGHSHEATAAPHSHTGGDDNNTVDAAAGSDVTAAAPGSTSSEPIEVTIEESQAGIILEETGAGQPFQILPPVFGVYWLVRA